MKTRVLACIAIACLTIVSLGGQASAHTRGHGPHPAFVVKSVRVPTAAAPQNLVTVNFNQPVRLSGPLPSVSPAVSGTWRMPRVRGKRGHWMLDTKTIQFYPAAPFVPGAQYSINMPTGRHGVEAIDKKRLHSDPAATWTISGTLLRLQQLLSQLGYLPLSWTPTTPTPTPDLASAQPGAFAWRWPMPTQLTSLWAQGAPNVILTGAVMQFEAANTIPETVTNPTNPVVWSALLRDTMTHTGQDAQPWDWVLVSQSPLPENQVVYSNGQVVHTNLVNTGIPSTPTTDGTWPVFEHLPVTTMSGTNPTGSHYTDPGIKWTSYFHGGDALHEFPRAAYGFPQSLGCVESTTANAAAVYPYTPIGTLVTVQGTPGA